MHPIIERAGKEIVKAQRSFYILPYLNSPCDLPLFFHDLVLTKSFVQTREFKIQGSFKAISRHDNYVFLFYLFLRSCQTAKQSRYAHITIFLYFLLSQLVWSVNFIKIWVAFCDYRTDDPEKDKDGTFRVFSYNELKAATGGFRSSEKIGEGGFGIVYKVILILVLHSEFIPHGKKLAKL